MVIGFGIVLGGGVAPTPPFGADTPPSPAGDPPPSDPGKSLPRDEQPTSARARTKATLRMRDLSVGVDTDHGPGARSTMSAPSCGGLSQWMPYC